MFNKLILAVATLAAVQTAIAAPQLSGLPSVVCMTGALTSAGSSLLDGVPGLSVVECAADETCTPLDVPVVGSLLPVGTCSAAAASASSGSGLLGGIGGIGGIL